MMAEMKIRYEGGWRISAEAQGHVIPSDQTEASGGENAAAQPFDIFVASLGMCMALYAMFYLEKHGYSAEGLTLDLEYAKSKKLNRLVSVCGTLRTPNADPGKRRQAVLRAALACPVHNSLREDVKFEMHYGEM